MSKVTFFGGMLAILLTLNIAALITTLLKHSCDYKEAETTPNGLPIWMKTNYYRDREGNCFAYTIENSRFGLSFIPDEACPFPGDTSDPLEEMLHGTSHNTDSIQQETMPANMRRKMSQSLGHRFQTKRIP